MTSDARRTSEADKLILTRPSKETLVDVMVTIPNEELISSNDRKYLAI